MSTFKIFFSADNIRRFRTEQRVTFDEFVSLMCKQYPSLFHPELRVQYTDTEGDRIDVNSQLEWEEMHKELAGEPIMKIHVLEGKTGQYFKDAPSPDPLYFYESGCISKKPVETDPTVDHLKVGIPLCLRELFPGKKILPHHIPQFLSPCISVTNLPNGEVDLDVDIGLLHRVLHDEGIKALETGRFEDGKKFFSCLCTLKPGDAICHYNLACSESLLRNVDSAFNLLKKSVDLGYDNLEHLRADPDLENLRSLGANLFEQLCKLLQPVKVSPEPTPEPTPEPVVVREFMPVQVPEPTPEPVVVRETPKEEVPFQLTDSMLMDPNLLSSGRNKWFCELTILHELGFLSDSVLIPILEANNGSVEKTVQEILCSI